MHFIYISYLSNNSRTCEFYPHPQSSPFNILNVPPAKSNAKSFSQEVMCLNQAKYFRDSKFQHGNSERGFEVGH
jgi:hypothetical protein